MNVFEKWPLGINEDMDRHAASHRLAHWSCSDPTGNAYWIRQDGFVHVFRGTGGYPDELRNMDFAYHMRRDEGLEKPLVKKERKMLKWSYCEPMWVANASLDGAIWRIHVIGPNTDKGKFGFSAFGLFSIHDTSIELFRDITWTPFQSLKAAQEFCQERENERNSIERSKLQVTADDSMTPFRNSLSRVIASFPEIKPPDLGLAYSALAPLVAEAWAYSDAGYYVKCGEVLKNARGLIEQVSNPPMFIQYPPKNQES